ncbi:MAG TPA: SDR family oxidoreductase, partial [Candidatus Dormibacteraeota bacterium]|nr:SDR family oxidoreductase [Candidatus Dormibacteraeota bacterium]
ASEGGSVFVVSRTGEHARVLAETVRAAGGRAAWRAAELSREAEVVTAFEAARTELGRIDGVFSAAGISGRSFGDGPLHEATLEGWDTVMAANATSQFLVCREAVRAMLDQEPDANGSRGAIVTMSSALATHPAPRFFATHAYAASKGAIEALTHAVSAFYARHGIRVNAIAPGLVATPMSRRAQTDPEIVAYLERRQPLARGPIAADDVAGTVLFLLSDEARMLTGQILAVEGGWAVSEG